MMRRISLAATMLVFLAGSVLAEDEIIPIGSGNTAGIYYAASSAVAKLFNRKRSEYHQWMDTEVSNGSNENINDVLQGTVKFGFAQANILDKATRGKGPWEGHPHKKIRAVIQLFTEDLTIVAAEDAEIYTMSDLKGKRINIGEPGSSDAYYARDILLLSGIRMSEVTLIEESKNKSKDLIAENKIDAYFFIVGHPAFSVREASSGKRKVRLIPIDLSLIEFCVASNSSLRASSIPIDYYPEIGNKEPIPSIGASAMLFTREDMAEETVYRMVKEVMENLDLFRQQHPALRYLEPKEMATKCPIPLHPGAQRYFTEAGLLQ